MQKVIMKASGGKYGSFIKTIMDSFAVRGDRMALINGPSDKRYRYSELNDIINRIAGNLYHAANLRKGDVVCVCAPNSVENALLQMAVPSIGGIVTGCNPAFTPGEVVQQMKESDATYLVTISAYQQYLPELLPLWPKIRQVYIIGEGVDFMYLPYEELLKPGPAAPDVYIDAKEDIGLLPFSSGTTGHPKGVLLTHYNIMAGLFAFRAINLTNEDTMVAVFPMFHVGGAVHSLFSALYNGCTVIFYPKFDFGNFLAATEKYKATTCILPPPVMLGLARDPRVSQYDLSDVRHILVGAAPLSIEIQEEVLQRLPNVKEIKQGYGSTENVGCCTFTRPGDFQLGSVGPAQPTVQFKIVDPETLEELPAGQDGEILMRGPAVMKGYLNNPAATADTIKNGWLHTGDIGHLGENGHLYIVDRLKELIKYNAYQVAPAELEALLLTHPDVAEAAVIGIPDLQTGEKPRAYVALKPGHKATEYHIQDFVQKRVAPYKWLRGGVEFVIKIPKSETGKILRRILRDKYRESMSVRSRI